MLCTSASFNIRRCNLSCSTSFHLKRQHFLPQKSHITKSYLIPFLTLICNQHIRLAYNHIHLHAAVFLKLYPACSQNIQQAISRSIAATEIKHRCTRTEKSCHLVPRPVIHKAKSRLSCHISHSLQGRRRWLDKSPLSICYAEGYLNQKLCGSMSVADPDLGGEVPHKQLYSRTDHDPCTDAGVGSL